MPEDDGLPLSSLFSSTALAVIEAQEALDRISGAPSAYAIPYVDASLRFGVIRTKKEKILFIPRGQTTNHLQHKVTFRLSAAPHPPQPLLVEPPGDDHPMPLELLEPPFIIDQEEERGLVDRLTTALAAQQWRAAMQ